MTPLNVAITELRVTCVVAEAAARQVPRQAIELDHHRTSIVGALLDALDRIDPGLGERYLRAMYPHVQPATDTANTTPGSPA